MTGTDELGHPRFVVFVIVASLLLLRTGHAGLNDHQRNQDGQDVHNTDDPNQHVGRVGEGRRDGFGLNRGLESFFVRTDGGSVQSVSTIVHDELDVLGNLVASGVGGSNAQSVDTGFKVARRDLHVRRQGAVVFIQVRDACQIRPRRGQGDAGCTAKVVGKPVLEGHDHDVVLNTSENIDFVAVEVLRTVAGRRGREDAD